MCWQTMADDSNSSPMAQAIRRTKMRIAEQEQRIARLQQIGAPTRMSYEFLARLHETLELQHYLQYLGKSCTELTATLTLELRAIAGGAASGAAASASDGRESSRPASAPDGRDPRHGASGSPRKA
jgi:hypothetical protein